jgi:hypothetical protein
MWKALGFGRSGETYTWDIPVHREPRTKPGLPFYVSYSLMKIPVSVNDSN